MKATKFYSYFCILLLTFKLSSAYAQSGPVFASTDQRVYVAGEKIWVFGKLGHNDSADTQELTVYLLDRNAGVISKHKILANFGHFFAGFSIKQTTISDNYVVMLAQGSSCIEFIPVMIINPVIPPAINVNTVVSGNKKQRREDRILDIQVAGYEKKQRETVQVNFSRSELPSDYFVSAYREDALSVFADSLFWDWSFEGVNQRSQQEQNDSRAPDKKRDQVVSVMRIRASLVDAAGKPVANVPILTSLLGSQSDLGYAATNEQGQLEIIHPFHYTDPPLVFTPLTDRDGLKILIEDTKDSFAFKFNLPAMQLRPEFKPAIDARVINASVFNAYAPESKQNLLTSKLDTTDFYGIPDKRYVLDDYKRFPDMQEIIQEFIPEVRVKKSVGKTILQVVNLPYKQFFEPGALVLLDGVPVLDIDQLLTLDPLKIYSIEVIGRKFFLGHLQLHGIVHYKSYKSDLAGYKMPPNQLIVDYKGLELPRIPAYLSDAASPMPDMRNTLYIAQLTDNDAGQFRFSTLDVEGRYVIRVVAIDAQGNIQIGKKEILVK
jgi:hypothetical protein